MIESILFLFTVFLGGLTQGLTGFGFLIFTLPILAMFMEIRLLVPLLCLFGLLINLYLNLRLRSHLNPTGLLPMLLATLPGIALGVYALKTLGPHWLKLMLGISITLFSLHLLRGNPPKRELPRTLAWLAGFLGGILGGSIGANGPPIIAYVTLQPWDKNRIKSTMTSYFFCAGIFISLGQYAGGMLTDEVFRLFALGLPAMGAGVFLGHMLYGRLEEAFYRKIVSWLFLVLGLFTLYKGIVF